MDLICNHLYHIYNQGNNKEIIFKDRDDYIKFLKKVKTMISPYCDIISYCLMPNHFHFLLDVNEKSCEKIVLGNIELTKLSNGF